MAAFPKFNGHVAANRIKKIQCPVLIIRGDMDVPFILHATDFYQHELPQAKMVTYPGVAHMLNLEKTAEFNRLLDEFL